MSKSMMTAAVAVLMAASPLAFAQTTAPSPATPPAQHATPPAEHTTPSDRTMATSSDRSAQNDFITNGDELRAAKIIGSTVYDRQNQDVGSVKDVLLDHAGKVHSVVLDVGAFLGMGGKYVTVSLSDLKTDNNRLTLDQTKDQLKSAPEFHFRTR